VLNLRYHVVSLVAVFLALGIGIIMGTTVIDRVTVDRLRQQLDRVEASVGQTRRDNDRLTTQLRTWERFADQGRSQLVAGQLRGVPVLLVGVQGIDRKPVDGLRAELLTAGAAVEGTVWLTSKLNLTSQGDATALAAALALPDDTPDVLRATALSRLATVLGGTGDPAGVVPALRQAGFVEYEEPPAPPSSTTTTPPLGPGAIPLAGTRYVVVSGAGARLDDDTMTMPFLVQLGLEGAPVIAAEAGQDTPGGRGVFVGLVRRNAETASRVSTIDNLESFMGQAAGVLALGELGRVPAGHYGVGPGAQRLLPEPAAGT
jgi:copper transport outer membrane protein MctB